MQNSNKHDPWGRDSQPHRQSVTLSGGEMTLSWGETTWDETDLG